MREPLHDVLRGDGSVTCHLRACDGESHIPLESSVKFARDRISDAYPDIPCD